MLSFICIKAHWLWPYQLTLNLYLLQLCAYYFTSISRAFDPFPGAGHPSCTLGISCSFKPPSTLSIAQWVNYAENVTNFNPGLVLVWIITIYCLLRLLMQDKCWKLLKESELNVKSLMQIVHKHKVQNMITSFSDLRKIKQTPHHSEQKRTSLPLFQQGHYTAWFLFW